MEILVESFEYKFSDPDFFCYCKDEKVFIYSGLLKESFEIDSKISNVRISTNDEKEDCGLILFTINGEKFPIVIPIRHAIRFDKITKSIHSFYGNFYEIVTNEIELYGNKIEQMTSSKVNIQTFKYLYRNDQRFNISIQIYFKRFEEMNSISMVGFKIKYPKEVNDRKTDLRNELQVYIYNLYKRDSNFFEERIKEQLKDLVKSKSNDSKFEIGLLNKREKIIDALDTGNIDLLVELFNTNFSNIPYDHFVDAKEGYYNAMINVILQNNIGINDFIDQRHVNVGRSDIIIFRPTKVYCLELKINKTADEALEQIFNKQYLHSYKLENKDLIAVGLNISTSEKRITDFKYKQYK